MSNCYKSIKMSIDTVIQTLIIKSKGQVRVRVRVRIRSSSSSFMVSGSKQYLNGLWPIYKHLLLYVVCTFGDIISVVQQRITKPVLNSCLYPPQWHRPFILLCMCCSVSSTRHWAYVDCELFPSLILEIQPLISHCLFYLNLKTFCSSDITIHGNNIIVLTKYNTDSHIVNMILSIPLKIETIFNRGTHFVVFCFNSVPLSSLTDILYIVNNYNQWLHTWETPPMHYMLADDRNLWTNAISDHYDQAAVEPDGSDWIELKVPIAPIAKVFPVFYSLISKWYYTTKV